MRIEAAVHTLVAGVVATSGVGETSNVDQEALRALAPANAVVQEYGVRIPNQNNDLVIGRPNEYQADQDPQPTAVPANIGFTAVAMVDAKEISPSASEAEISVPTVPSFEIPQGTYAKVVVEFGPGPITFDNYISVLQDSPVNPEALQNFTQQARAMESYLNGAFQGDAEDGLNAKVAFTYTQGEEVYAALYYETNRDMTSAEGEFLPAGSGIVAVPSESGYTDLFFPKPMGDEHHVGPVFVDTPQGKVATLANIMDTEGGKIVTGIKVVASDGVVYDFSTANAVVASETLNVRDGSGNIVQTVARGAEFPITHVGSMDFSSGIRYIGVAGPTGEELFVAQGGEYTVISGPAYDKGTAPEASEGRAPGSYENLTQQELDYIVSQAARLRKSAIVPLSAVEQRSSSLIGDIVSIYGIVLEQPQARQISYPVNGELVSFEIYTFPCLIQRQDGGYEIIHIDMGSTGAHITTRLFRGGTIPAAGNGTSTVTPLEDAALLVQPNTQIRVDLYSLDPNSAAEYSRLVSEAIGDPNVNINSRTDSYMRYNYAWSQNTAGDNYSAIQSIVNDSMPLETPLIRALELGINTQ